MSNGIINKDTTLAMNSSTPIVAEMDSDVSLEIESPEGIKVTLDNPQVITQELSGDSAVGMIAGSLNSLAKESTIVEESEKLSTKLIENRALLDGKFGDVFVKFGELTTFIASKFDWVANFIVTKKDELQQFISDRKLELHNLIAIDILGAINRNYDKLIGRTNDIIGNLEAHERNAALRNQDTIDVVNSQGSQLGVHLDDNKWALMGKIDELRGDNQDATNSKILEKIDDLSSKVDMLITMLQKEQ